jgi:hypothetical protein
MTLYQLQRIFSVEWCERIIISGELQRNYVTYFYILFSILLECLTKATTTQRPVSTQTGDTTGHLPDTSERRYYLSQLARSFHGSSLHFSQRNSLTVTMVKKTLFISLVRILPGDEAVSHAANSTEKLVVAQRAMQFSAFLDREVSLPCSQEPATGSYPEPFECSQHLDILIYVLILYFHLRLGLANSLFPWGFSTKILYVFFMSPMRDAVRPIIFGEQCVLFWRRWLSSGMLRCVVW